MAPGTTLSISSNEIAPIRRTRTPVSSASITVESGPFRKTPLLNLKARSDSVTFISSMDLMADLTTHSALPNERTEDRSARPALATANGPLFANRALANLLLGTRILT